MDYNVLFTPMKIGNMKVKNRIAMAPMGLNAAHIDGTIADVEIDYFEERAKGGVGLLVMGCQFITKDLAQGSLEGCLDGSHVIPKLTTMCEAAHRYGSKIVAQVSCGTGRNAFASMYSEPPVSASAIPSFYNPDILCKALTEDDIAKIMEEFAFSAKLCKDAGFDALEVHAHAGYLVDQFMSSIWNKREDKYGGSLENRMRFAVEIVEAMRGAVGDMPIIFRLALKHNFEGGRKLDESIEMLQILEKAGVDAFDVDSGSYETIDYIFPPAYLGDACMADVCETAKKAVNVPIINAGNHTPETGVELINSGNADFVSFGRPLIADSYLPKKLLNGKREEVRPCVRCNGACIGRIIGRRTQITCATNPSVGFEKRFAIEKTECPLNVVIVGGGPAGLEAARTASIIGHKVDLYEMESELGGQLRCATTADFKTQLKDLVTWYENEMKLHNVNLHMNTKLTPDSEVLKNADKIIVGAGAVSFTPDIKGVDNALDILEAHLDETKIKGETIVYLGGGLSACDSALEHAQKGKKVIIIEQAEDIAIGDNFINRASLLPMLDKNGAKIYAGHKVVEVKENSVICENAQNEKVEIKGDTIIKAFGMKPDTSVSDKIDDMYHTKTIVVGDNVKVGRVGEAVRSGMYAAMNLDY